MDAIEVTAISIGAGAGVISIVSALVYLMRFTRLTRLRIFLPFTKLDFELPPPNDQGSTRAGVREILDLEDTKSQLDRMVAEIEASLRERLGQLDVDAQPIWETFGQINTKIDSLDKDIGQLRQFIVQDPNRALELPLLGKDIEALRRDVERVEGQLKWQLGIVVMIAIGLVAAIIAVAQ